MKSKKELPDLKTYSVLPPDMDYIYFEGSDDYPFEPKESGYSPANAWWLAEFAFLAYCHRGFCRMAVKLAGFDYFRFFQGRGTECLVASNKKTAVVAFRGTELNSFSTFHEIITDLDTIPVDFPGGGKVHRGFLNGLNEIWEGDDGLKREIERLLDDKPKRPLWITGHSLGGALAELCFALVPRAKGLYVYGAPRVGNSDFAELINDRPVWRVEHGRDPVPLVPPDIPVGDFCFRDGGKQVYIDSEGKILPERPVLDAAAEIGKVRDTLREQNKRRLKLAGKALKKETGGTEIRAAIQSHIDQAVREWKEYFSALEQVTGLKVLDHMPIYYCIRLWNNLILS